MNFHQLIRVNTMNDRMQYKIRGWTYTAQCLNPFQRTITINDLPQSALEVRVRASDELVNSSARHVRSWSLVKVDVEGYEGLMMEGAKETILRTETLVMEFSPELLKKRELILLPCCKNFPANSRASTASRQPNWFPHRWRNVWRTTISWNWYLTGEEDKARALVVLAGRLRY